jgi:hypothetical protein
LAPPFCSSSRISHIKFPSGRDVHNTYPKGKEKNYEKKPTRRKCVPRQRELTNQKTGHMEHGTQEEEDNSTAAANRIKKEGEKNENFPQNINICEKETTVLSQRGSIRCDKKSTRRERQMKQKES